MDLLSLRGTLNWVLATGNWKLLLQQSGIDRIWNMRQDKTTPRQSYTPWTLTHQLKFYQVFGTRQHKKRVLIALFSIVLRKNP